MTKKRTSHRRSTNDRGLPLNSSITTFEPAGNYTYDAEKKTSDLNEQRPGQKIYVYDNERGTVALWSYKLDTVTNEGSWELDYPGAAYYRMPDPNNSEIDQSIWAKNELFTNWLWDGEKWCLETSDRNNYQLDCIKLRKYSSVRSHKTGLEETKENKRSAHDKRHPRANNSAPVFIDPPLRVYDETFHVNAIWHFNNTTGLYEADASTFYANMPSPNHHNLFACIDRGDNILEPYNLIDGKFHRASISANRERIEAPLATQLTTQKERLAARFERRPPRRQPTNFSHYHYRQTQRSTIYYSYISVKHHQEGPQRPLDRTFDPNLERQYPCQTKVSGFSPYSEHRNTSAPSNSPYEHNGSGFAGYEESDDDYTAPDIKRLTL